VGQPDNISNKEKNKKKDTVCYQWKCSRWYSEKRGKKIKKTRKTQKWKDGFAIEL